MAWIEGIAQETNFHAYGFYKPAHLFKNGAPPARLSRTRLQRFTNVLNVASYFLGPVIALIRLIGAAILYSQVKACYNNRILADYSRAHKYVKWMALRGVADFLGPLSAIFDAIATKEGQRWNPENYDHFESEEDEFVTDD